MRIAGAILAAGRSVRFGHENKLLASYQGKPLVRHAIEAMARVHLDAVCLVAADEATAQAVVGTSVRTVFVEPFNQSASLRAAVSWAIDEQADFLLIALGDMPHIDADILCRLVRKSVQDGAAACGCASFRSAPACFSHSMFGALLELKGDKGAGKIIQTLPPDQIISVSRDMLWDVDERTHIR